MLNQLRKDGRALAAMLTSLRDERPIVIAIPRRGVIVGAEIAHHLGAMLDVVLVEMVGDVDRGAPFGALELGGARVVDAAAVARLGLSEPAVEHLFAEARTRLELRHAAIRADAPLPPLEGRLVVLVDDAVVSGLTMRTALDALEQRQVGAIVVATPLAADEVVRRLARRVRSWVSLERGRSADVAVRHATASGQICPPIGDLEIRNLLLPTWREARGELGALEIDGV